MINNRFIFYTHSKNSGHTKTSGNDVIILEPFFCLECKGINGVLDQIAQAVHFLEGSVLVQCLGRADLEACIAFLGARIISYYFHASMPVGF